MMKVFVYGTLKPNERNYLPYCEGKIVESILAYTDGELFHLVSLGYPAMTEGNHRVQGVLLTFRDRSALPDLDELEDYQADRSPRENDYQRRQLPVYSLTGESLGFAWGYLMTRSKIAFYGGIPVSSGWWTERE
jgi:gamma-glutamylcyclotransferase (GGCT)/AIG2-like uncharacterized protein YtfP